MLLVGLAAMMLILIGLVLGLMTLLAWMGWPRLALAIGAAGAAYFAVTAALTLSYCSGTPDFVPPTAEDAPIWTRIAGCEGPGGALSYAYAWLAAPVSSWFLAVSTWRRWSRWKELENA